jgi:diacylglycerol kinase
MESLPRKKTGFASLARSFSFAFDGIVQVIRGQRNFRIHLVFALIVIISGYLFSISTTEWCIVLFTIGLVLSMEVFNTAVEKLVDFISPGFHPMAGKIKDIAAGGVLITAIAAILIGLIIFIPKIIQTSN